MKKTIYLIILAFIFLGVIGYTIAIILTPPLGAPTGSSTPIATSTTSASPDSTQSATSPEASPRGTMSKVKMYMVKIADNGPVGCGDFIVPLEREIPKTPTVLKDTLNTLLSLHRSEFPNADYYSGFFSSQLQVENASIVNGTAKINLTGTLSLGGVCDSPRVQEQLIQTAKQFPTVKEVEIYINGKPLKDILSEKG